MSIVIFQKSLIPKYVQIHNPNFKGVDFDTFVNESDSNSFVIRYKFNYLNYDKKERDVFLVLFLLIAYSNKKLLSTIIFDSSFIF